MPLVLADRVRESSTTVGTGTFTLAGAVAGFQSFAIVGDGNTTYYTIVDGNAGTWEVGIGTYTSSGTTLSRDTVLASTNSNNLVVFGAGTKDVFVTYPAGKSVYEDASNNVSLPAAMTAAGVVTGNVFVNTNEFYYNGRNVTENRTIAGTENAMSVGPITIDDGFTVTIDDGGEWVIV
jgi:hypothetical protein